MGVQISNCLRLSYYGKETLNNTAQTSSILHSVLRTPVIKQSQKKKKKKDINLMDPLLTA